MLTSCVRRSYMFCFQDDLYEAMNARDAAAQLEAEAKRRTRRRIRQSPSTNAVPAKRRRKSSDKATPVSGRLAYRCACC